MGVSASPPPADASPPSAEERVGRKRLVTFLKQAGGRTSRSARLAYVRALGAAYERLRAPDDLERNLGYVFDGADSSTIAELLPEGWPPFELFEDVAAELEKSAPSAMHQRTMAWTLATEAALSRAQGRPDPNIAVTTYGPVSTRDGLRFAAIQYLRPVAAFRRGLRPRTVMVGEHEFMLVQRPWLPVDQSSGAVAGSCWVVPSRGPAAGRPTLLTVQHAVVPKKARPGESVTIDALRADPPGKLVVDDPVMDLALIAVDQPSWWHEMSATPISAELSSKPVLMVTGHGDVRLQVEEQTSPRGTIFASPDQPVRVAALCTLSGQLASGDSGCIGLDLEVGQWSGNSPPYLIYCGVLGMGSGLAGYALVLEQPRRVWGLEFYAS